MLRINGSTSNSSWGTGIPMGKDVHYIGILAYNGRRRQQRKEPMLWGLGGATTPHLSEGTQPHFWHIWNKVPIFEVPCLIVVGKNKNTCQVAQICFFSKDECSEYYIFWTSFDFFYKRKRITKKITQKACNLR